MHLADLHIGKIILEQSLIEDQKYILNQIIDIIVKNNIDVVLIAGDVYDKNIPNIDAVRLFSDFLSNLYKLKVKVFVISGNHDSKDRLSFGNELFIDIPYMVMHEAKANNILNDFSIFMSFVNSGALDIKRFTKRELTEEEQIINIRTNNYKKETAEENILRDFKYLSASSKKENLEAAVSAYSVFEQFSKAGISIEEMKTNAEIRNLIGVAIHTDWLKRNPNHENEDLKVAYSNLDEWTKSQDLTVFDALVSVAQQNNVVINKEDGFNLPDYLLEEQMILENIRNKKM